MKKKILSLLVLLAAAVSGAWAEERLITIADGGYNQVAIPDNFIWAFNENQMILTADEIGCKGRITSVAYKRYSEGSGDPTSRNIDIYMVHTTKDAYGSKEEWIPVTSADLVYSGEFTFQTAGEDWQTITLDTPFEYNGTDNLCICIDDNTGSTTTRIYWSAHHTSNISRSIRAWGSYNFDPTQAGTPVGGSSLTGTFVADIQLGIYFPTFDLTEGENEHGTITFKIGENEVTEAAEGKEVTVVVTPDEGYEVKEVTGRWYAAMAASRARRESTNPDLLKDFTPTAAGENTYTFTMKRANAELSATYKKLLTNSDITIEAIPAETYTGSEIEPTIVVKDGSTVLEKDVDYTVTYSNNINAAASDAAENAPTVTITAVATSENYAGETSTTFTINPAVLSDDMIAAIAEQTFTGSEILPELTITFGEGENAQTLVKGTDYTVAGENNVNVGTATITATGQGNFTGTASADFTIVSKALSDDMISPIDDLEYTGEPLEPGLNVNYGDNNLVEGTDYTVEYADNVEAGKATVTITGMGNYEGTATANFYIGRKDLNDETIKVEYIFWEHYDGEEHTPQLTIRDGTKQLIEDKDYKLTFKENIDAGTARVTIEGLGNYKGKVKKYFAIFSYVLDEDMVQAIADQVWTGEAVTPAISVINGNMTLTQDKDFTVKFKNNVNEGTATAIINGTGNFRSIDLVKTFKIVKKAEVTDPEAVDAPGEATAINGVSGKTADHGQAYDLGGRKVVGNRKGVVIIDGKLVLKK